jgi:hypothetical protein
VNRRSFLRGLFAAPAIIAVDRLMPIKAQPLLWGIEDRSYLGEVYRSVESAFPIIKGDGAHDDGPGIQAFFDGLDYIDEFGGFRTEINAEGHEIKHLPSGVFYVKRNVTFPALPTRTLGFWV